MTAIGSSVADGYPCTHVYTETMHDERRSDTVCSAVLTACNTGPDNSASLFGGVVCVFSVKSWVQYSTKSVSNHVIFLYCLKVELDTLHCLWLHCEDMLVFRTRIGRA